MSTNREELSKEELELHQIMLSRTRLKSSMRTSTLMAGFALVRTDMLRCLSSLLSTAVTPFALRELSCVVKQFPL